MAITWRSFRAAWNTFVGQAQSGQAKASGDAGVFQNNLRQQQLVEESNRLERISGVGPVHNRKRGGLTVLLSPSSGAINLVELNCSCGESVSYTRDELELYLGGAGRNTLCNRCKRVWNFAKETKICLTPVAGAAPQDELKPYDAFFEMAAQQGADISATDYAKGADGNYWLHITKTRNVLSLLDYAASPVHREETGPLVLPTDGPEPKVDYESFDPGKDSAGFGSLASQRDMDALPRSWIKKRMRAQLREERAYGRPKVDDFENDVEERMKEYDKDKEER